MWGGDDPDERKPMIWPEMTFDPETNHPLGKSRPHDIVAFDTTLHDEYRALMRLRSAERALRRGAYRLVATFDAEDAFVFERSAAAERILVVINNGDRSTLTIPLPQDAPGSRWRDLRSGDRITAGNGTLAVTVEGVSGRILKAEQ